MEVKLIEGTEYILKSDIDDLVRARLSKVSERARIAEGRVSELEESVEASSGASTQLIELQNQVESLTGELAQSKNLYSVHSTIAKHGFVDPDLRDLIEWQYNRAIKDMDTKEQPDLESWLSTIKEAPEKAPTALRPHLQSIAPAAPPAAPEPPPEPTQVSVDTMDRQQLLELVMAARAAQQPPPAEVPAAITPAQIQNHSTSVMPKPKTEIGNLIDRALADKTGDLWKKHNVEIQALAKKERRVPASFLYKQK
jgi:hypothetical protein